MKLHNAASFMPCGQSVLMSILGGERWEIEREIMSRRKKLRKPRGWMCKRNWRANTAVTYLSEIKQILKDKKGINTRFRYLRKKPSVKKFAEGRRGTCLVFIREHILIIQNGRVWDNNSAGTRACWHPLSDCKVKAYAIIG